MWDFSTLRGRIYLPQDELEQFGITEEDVFSRKVTDKWREFMKLQITRARFYFSQAEEGASQLDKDSRWPVISCSTTILCHSFNDLKINHFPYDIDYCAGIICKTYL